MSGLFWLPLTELEAQQIAFGCAVPEVRAQAQCLLDAPVRQAQNADRPVVLSKAGAKATRARGVPKTAASARKSLTI